MKYCQPTLPTKTTIILLMNNWHLLYSTPNLTQANILKGMLEENHIQVMMINKQDSSYLNFGEVELYVPSHLKELAKNLMDKALMN